MATMTSEFTPEQIADWRRPEAYQIDALVRSDFLKVLDAYEAAVRERDEAVADHVAVRTELRKAANWLLRLQKHYDPNDSEHGGDDIAAMFTLVDRNPHPGAALL